MLLAFLVCSQVPLYGTMSPDLSDLDLKEDCALYGAAQKRE